VQSPSAPDPLALRRRVLLTGALTLGLFLVLAYVTAALEISGVWLLVAMAGVWLVVVRPLMRPVQEAVRLRRRLAYQAYLEGQAHPEGREQEGSRD